MLLVFAFGCSSESPTPGDEPSAVKERDVQFETSDGLTLTGRLFGTGGVGVTLAHAFPADARSLYPAAEAIAEAGYVVLAFNFRGYADSSGTKNIASAPVDVAAARDMLEDQGAKEFAFVGASMGGTASLIAAATLDPLTVVTVSAPLRFRRLDAASIAGRVQRPALLMASRDDGEAMESLNQLRSALPNPDTKVFDGSAHGTGLLDARPEAVEEIVTFLQRYAPLRLPVPTTEP